MERGSQIYKLGLECSECREGAVKEREIIIEIRLKKCIQSSILFCFDPSRAAKRKPQPEESKVQRRESSMCVQKFRTFISSTTSLWVLDTSKEFEYVRS